MWNPFNTKAARRKKNRKAREEKQAAEQYRHHARAAAVAKAREERLLFEARNHAYVSRNHCEWCWKKSNANPDVIAAHDKAKAAQAASTPPRDPARAKRHAQRKAQRRKEREARHKAAQREIELRQKHERWAREKRGQHAQEMLRAAKNTRRIAQSLPPDVAARINERQRRLEREALRLEKPWLFEPDVDVTAISMDEFVDYLAGKNLGEHSFKKLHEERKARRQRKIYRNQQRRIKARKREKERQWKVLSDAKAAKAQWEEDMKQHEADLMVEQARAAAAMIAEAAQHVLAEKGGGGGKGGRRGSSKARGGRGRSGGEVLLGEVAAKHERRERRTENALQRVGGGRGNIDAHSQRRLAQFRLLGNNLPHKTRMRLKTIYPVHSRYVCWVCKSPQNTVDLMKAIEAHTSKGGNPDDMVNPSTSTHRLSTMFGCPRCWYPVEEDDEAALEKAHWDEKRTRERAALEREKTRDLADVLPPVSAYMRARLDKERRHRKMLQRAGLLEDGEPIIYDFRDTAPLLKTLADATKPQQALHEGIAESQQLHRTDVLNHRMHRSVVKLLIRPMPAGHRILTLHMCNDRPVHYLYFLFNSCRSYAPESPAIGKVHLYIPTVTKLYYLDPEMRAANPFANEWSPGKRTLEDFGFGRDSDGKTVTLFLFFDDNRERSAHVIRTYMQKAWTPYGETAKGLPFAREKEFPPPNSVPGNDPLQAQFTSITAAEEAEQMRVEQQLADEIQAAIKKKMEEDIKARLDRKLAASRLARKQRAEAELKARREQRAAEQEAARVAREERRFREAMAREKARGGNIADDLVVEGGDDDGASQAGTDMGDGGGLDGMDEAARDLFLATVD